MDTHVPIIGVSEVVVYQNYCHVNNEKQTYMFW